MGEIQSYSQNDEQFFFSFLGKKRPIYHKRNGRKKTPPLSTNLCAIQEDKILEGYVNKIQKVHRTRIPIPSRLTDYDMAILESIEV